LLTHPDDPEDFDELSNNLLREDEKIISDILALGGRKPVAVCRMA
jgi:hypothetical protein